MIENLLYAALQIGGELPGVLPGEPPRLRLAQMVDGKVAEISVAFDFHDIPALLKIARAIAELKKVSRTTGALRLPAQAVAT